MTYLPSPDAKGRCYDPLRQIELETRMGLCHCGCGQSTVYHEDGTVCLPQTVKIRNNLSPLLVLSQTRFLYPFAAYLQLTNLDPQEFILVRDEMTMETWSLAFGLASPQIVSLCYMAVHNRDQFETLGIIVSEDQIVQPFSAEHISWLETTVSEYLRTLPEMFFTKSHWKKIIKPMSYWSPMQLLHAGVKSNSELGNFFGYTQQFGDDGLTLALCMMNPLSVTLLHMAKFNPDSYGKLIKLIGDVPDPGIVRDNSVEMAEKELKLELSLAEYMVAMLKLLNTTELEQEQYTDDDWHDLFDL